MSSLIEEADLFQRIIADACLGEADKFYLSFFKYEFKRQVLFLRVSNGAEVPEHVTACLKASAESHKYRLRVTEAWATMSDLQEAVGEVTWLWKEWVPQEMITLLAGEPGTGKSTLALWLCKCAIEGLPWPDGTRGDPGKVVFVDAESAQVITKERCIHMRLPMDRVYVPNLGNDMLTQPDLNDDSHKEQLYNMVDQVRPSLVVVDSLGGVKSGGENRKEEMQPTLLYLTRLVQNKGSALMVVHHLNKTKREESEEIALNHVRGSSTIAQFSRSVLFLATKPTGTKLWVGKSNVAKRADPLRVEFKSEEFISPEGRIESVVRGFEFSPWQEEVKVTKIDECKRWIEEILMEAEGRQLTAADVFERAKVEMPFTPHMIKDAAASLERKGIIHRTGGKGSIWSLLQMDEEE